MPLPTIETPTFTLVLPSTGKTITYRPFLVKEEKILLMSLESDSEQEAIKGLRQVIQNCVQADFDVDGLPLFDLEYLFLQLRARSVGEIIDAKFHCQTSDCTNILEFKVDLSKIEVIKTEGHDKTIALTDNIGLIMKYPSFESFVKHLSTTENVNTENFFDLIIDCVDAIYDKDQVYSSRDCAREEIIEFIEKLTQEQAGKIRVFFDTMPKLKHVLSTKCEKCGKEQEIILETFSDFFGLDSTMSP